MPRYPDAAAMTSSLKIIVVEYNGVTYWQTLRKILNTQGGLLSVDMTVVETIKSAVGLGDGVQATQEQMSEARLPMAYRDSCAHLLIPLNQCRRKEYYLPWKCENERHTYEKCQYEEFKKRVAKMDEIRASKNGERSN